MTAASVEKSYLSRVQDWLSSSSVGSAAFNERFVELLRQPDKHKTRVLYTNAGLESQVRTPSDLVACSAKDQNSGREAICVIENISPSFIEELGSAWDLDPEFFIGHAKNPNPEELWARYHPGEYDMREYRHLDGVFEYHGVRGQKSFDSLPNYFPRHCFEKAPYPVQSNTRISYYRVHRGLYLFLVDPPLDIMLKPLGLHPRDRTTLRLLYAMNRGGILLPQLFSQAKYSLFDSLEATFQHGWHFGLFFDGDEGAFPDQPLLYTLSNSLWESNLKYLTDDIHRISFEEVHNPSLKINNALHARRENLAFMKTILTETIKRVPSKAVKYFDEHIYYVNKALRGKSVTPIENHHLVLEQTVELDRLLMETFQLLMSSISVRDSQLSIEQSQRATRLTQLAFIYVPLSFVTGIFGMNVQQINATGLSIWVCFVTLAIIIALTAGIFWALHSRGNKRKEPGGLASV